MKQHKNSTMIAQEPGYDLLLIKTIHSARQGGNIWRNEIHHKLIRINFTQIQIDLRVYYFENHNHFTIICIVVHDI